MRKFFFAALLIFGICFYIDYEPPVDEISEALEWALMAEPPTEVKRLLDAGADIEMQDAHGKTAIHHAIWRGDLDIIKTLIQAGANIEAHGGNGRTVLHLAVRDKNRALISFLLNAGASIEARDSLGRTPLMYAAVPFDKGFVCGTFLQRSSDAQLQEKSEFFSWFTEHEPDLDVRDNSGCNALMWAAQRGNSDDVDTLLKAGVDINGVDAKGRSNLMLLILNASSMGSVSSGVELLIKLGADVTQVDNQGMTALIHAMANPAAECIEILMNAASKMTQ